MVGWLFPDTCIMCRREGELACRECLSVLSPLNVQQCPGCFCESPEGKFCPRCKKQDSALDFLLVGTSYRDSPIVSLLIKTMKYKSISRCISYIPSSLFSSIENLCQFSLNIALVPVPLHKKRQRERGFNQATIIARHIASLTGVGIDEHLIKRVRYTIPQASLGKYEREINLRNAFSIVKYKERDPERLYLLIDDVATTRSTLEECAKTMRAAGIKKVGAYVIARK